MILRLTWSSDYFSICMPQNKILRYVHVARWRILTICHHGGPPQSPQTTIHTPATTRFFWATFWVRKSVRKRMYGWETVVAKMRSPNTQSHLISPPPSLLSFQTNEHYVFVVKAYNSAGVSTNDSDVILTNCIGCTSPTTDGKMFLFNFVFELWRIVWCSSVWFAYRILCSARGNYRRRTAVSGWNRSGYAQAAYASSLWARSRHRHWSLRRSRLHSRMRHSLSTQE